ncbi:hypothetical protein TSOC_008654, partial [Tetrabaena socialis]
FKIKLIRDVLALDVTVVVSDIDTAWVKNPIPYIHRYPEADILTSTDQLGPTVQDDSLERFPDAGSAFNIGIMLFRPTSKAFVGNIPGSAWKKPFICPADHVLDLEGGWHRHRMELGPKLEYREYSFFQNPRLPPHVNNSRVNVRVCLPGEAGCASGDGPAPIKDGVLRLAPDMNSDQIAKALEGTQGIKVLTLSNAASAFKQFSEPDAQARFENRLKHYTSVFCCLEKNPGWIWYDFYADRPHTDRFNRKFETWLPKHGDVDTNVEGYKVPGRRSLLELGAAGQEAQEAQARFENRLKHYTSVFCCLEKNPGWIWYDFYADRPHTDRFNRKFETWLPKHGDVDTNVEGYKVPGRRSLLELGAAGQEAQEAGAAEEAGTAGQQQWDPAAELGLGLPQRLGLPRRLQSEEAEQLQEVRFLRTMHADAMFSEP